MVEQHGITNYVLKKNDELITINENSFDKVLISPGPGVAREAGQLMDFIKNYHRSKSMLGICLGFEALAENFSTEIIPLSRPMHGLRNRLILSGEHYIFKGLPKNFMIGHYHSWTLDGSTFPPVLQTIATDESGMIMGFSHKKYDLTGLMFHPESIMTEYGFEMIGNWLEHLSAD